MIEAGETMIARIRDAEFAVREGWVRAIHSNHVEATGPLTTIGELCAIATDHGGSAVAEVAAAGAGRVILTPLEAGRTIRVGAIVRSAGRRARIEVGDGYAGRAVDALGRPIDGGAAITPVETAPLGGVPLRPLERRDPAEALATGIRAIDALLTLGVGQRVGVIAASGVGKTSLIEQLARQADCDHLLLCLVGERGREVEALWRTLKSARLTVVAATSDESAAMRARAVERALALAEYWRDAGTKVLLIVDSVTRYAMALREIGLAAGEPPTVRAYTPNVFAMLPRVVERCGATANGAITAVFTVLAETDDLDDPIAELMRSLLDGHVLLSRRLADMGHFPAIDISRSVSRNADRLRMAAHETDARALSRALGAYDEARVMIESGLYKPGTNTLIDTAIATRDEALGFLQQERDQTSPLATTLADLARLASRIDRHG